MAQSSTIDAYLADLGVKPDADIAKLAGVSVSAVYQYRHARGIGVVKRAKTRGAPTKPAPKKAKPAPAQAPALRVSKLDALMHLIGVLPDAEIARRAGVSRERVREVRLKLGEGKSGSTSGSKVAAAPVARPNTVTATAAQNSGPAGGTAPTLLRTTGTSCWRVSLRDGSVSHLAAGSCEEAARKAHAALGPSAVGVVWLGALL